jgi:3-phosphoshikimate 1-carboxyvinyltransferase
MGRIIEPLTQMGAVIESVDGHAPLKIHGKYPLNAISYTPPKPSAQVKSCVLLAGLFSDGETTVMEYVPTRDHTERMLPHFGIDARTLVSIHGRFICVSGKASLTANDLTVPGDISSAAFFMIAAACRESSEIIIENLGVNPSRAAIMDVLKNFGVNIEFKNERPFGSEPAADVRLRAEKLFPAANVINRELTAALIDEIPILAILGTQLEDGLEIYDAGELRIKESDRIKSVVGNLKAMGADVRELPDGLRVGRSTLKGAKVDSFGDHRIAMAFAVAGLLAEGETEITDAECVNISYPGFFEALEEIVIR